MVLVEEVIAVIGAILVGIVSLYAVKQDWNTPGLDISVSKLLLAIMAFGCVVVILSATGVIGNHGG